MFKFLSRTRKLPIALDIGADSIKMLQLAEAAQGWRISAAASWSYPKVAELDSTQRREMTITAVANMLKKGDFAGRDVVTALSCEQLGIKNIRLPSMPENELREAIKWEAKERFGFEVRDDQFSYLNAGEVRSGNDTNQEIILLVADQKVVDDHLALLADMKLCPVTIDAAPLALHRVFERYLRRKGDEQSVCVVVDIGCVGTRMVISRSRQIVFIKNIEIGGRSLTNAVAKQYNLNYEEASQLRQRIVHQIRVQSPDTEGQESKPDSQSVEWSIHDAIRGEMERLSSELALCLRYCSVTFRGLRPSQVILSGGEAYDPAVTKLLAEYLDVECVVGQPLRGMNVEVAGLGDGGKGNYAQWALCAGLAVGTLNNQEGACEVEHGQDRLSA